MTFSSMLKGIAGSRVTGRRVPIIITLFLVYPLTFFEAGWLFGEGVAAELETILSLEMEAVLFGREDRP